MKTATVWRDTALAEWMRLWSVRSTWLFGGATVAGAIGLVALISGELRDDAEAGDSAWTVALTLGLPVLFGILVLASIASTADHGTGGIVPTLQWTPRRGVLLTARTFVLVLATSLLGLLVVVVTALMVGLYVPQVDVLTSHAGTALWRAGVVYVTATLMAVGLGMLSRSTAATLAAVFALILILPLVLQVFPFTWVDQLIELLPGSGALFLLVGEGPGSAEKTAASAAMTLGAWAAVAFVAGGWRLVRGDADK